MTQINRLALNTVVSYSRSLLALFLGLFSARWVLQALGQEDFGLYGVVGSIITSISFLNLTLSGSVSRFYAFTIGREINIGVSAFRQEMTEYYNAAMCLHVFVAALMLLIGWPLGEYAIQHILVIPSHRVDSCLWVLRFSIFSSLVSVVAVPYIALYTAYQYIAEMTVFDIIRTILNFVNAAILIHVSCDHLLLYSMLMALSGALVTLAQLWRAKCQFPLDFKLFKIKIEIARIRDIGVYGAFKIMGVLGWLIKSHGSAFAINLSFGPKANAAYSIANQVVAHSTALSSSLMNAIAPALTTFAGAGDKEKMKKYAISACKLSGLLVLFFAVPILCEIDYILRLWLKAPPAESAKLCSLFIVAFFVDVISLGHVMAICSLQNIGRWQLIEFLLLLLTAPVTYVLYRLSFSFLTIGVVFIICSTCIMCERVYFGYRLIGISPKTWISQVLARLLTIFCIAYPLGCLAHNTFPGSPITALVTVLAAVFLIMLLGAWFFLFDASERLLLSGMVAKIRRKFVR